MSRLICGLLLGLCMIGTPSWAKRPITHEDVWLMKRVGAPVASPDGKWAIFSVREPSYDPKQEVSDLWIVPVDGSQPARRLTSTKGGEGDVVWSPDSTRIAFSAKREGETSADLYPSGHRRRSRTLYGPIYGSCAAPLEAGWSGAPV